MRILCVDDDGLVLAVTADLLRELGHDVVEAGGGGRAAEIIAAAGPPIDMLVTDIHMPGGPDGLQLAEYARRQQPGLPVIYFSGLAHVVPRNVEGVVLSKLCSLGQLQQAIEAMH
ncbi:response regulator [Sphingomonas sp. SRS2]|uniref:response regulator n=1 Tax=Sphingomonas sp. SRS2 TaxID=133190 RepID=UPI0006184896|nr:response regulator [Sphingomonas sp. SRS2]KKC23916.1 response regulator receiver protein [Sphingomonas sp. SRS2]